MLQLLCYSAVVSVVCTSELISSRTRALRSFLMDDHMYSAGELLLLQQDNENARLKANADEKHRSYGGGNKTKSSQDSLYAKANNGDQRYVADESANSRLMGFVNDDNATPHENLRPNCSLCLLREEAKLARIERVKIDLLNKLGLKKPPNGTVKTVPPMLPHLRGMLSKWGFDTHSMLASDGPYTAREDLRPEDDSAKVEQIYIIAQKTPKTLVKHEETNALYFQFSPTTLSSVVENAQLHFYVRPNPASNDLGTMKLVIYRINGKNGQRTMIGVREFKKHGHFHGHWDRIDMTQTVRTWFSKPELNFGLVMHTVNSNVSLTYPAPESPADADKQRQKEKSTDREPTSAHSDRRERTTYLSLAVRDTKATRMKREVPRLDCSEKDNEPRCCRYPLVIDFASFGWDWVIVPKKYMAYYCAGECPFRHLQRYMHTHLVQQINMEPLMGPCCYPTQMAPILMVYFNENKEVLVSKIPGMVVTRCGCA
ncbi:growth:differentiation factor 11 [Trichuris trichiura]|uniref:Growth:differentiation factor 11 n=1 Tax=Trichuris trichiura TaxID=36087 RepID=A0A077Z3B3_TRITR|nr:growth:differentiation factor 11 [Trichuris trichiura]